LEKKVAPIRDDLEAHDHAMGISIHSVVGELAELLGATTVAVIGGVTETRAVHQWMNDRVPQRPHVLRFALQIASMIASVAERDVARAWFHGSNPRLGDRSPMFVLRDHKLAEVQFEMLAAARAFVKRV
jgi:hypothetical protein